MERQQHSKQWVRRSCQKKRGLHQVLENWRRPATLAQGRTCFLLPYSLSYVRALQNTFLCKNTVWSFKKKAHGESLGKCLWNFSYLLLLKHIGFHLSARASPSMRFTEVATYPWSLHHYHWALLMLGIPDIHGAASQYIEEAGLDSVSCLTTSDFPSLYTTCRQNTTMETKCLASHLE